MGAHGRFFTMGRRTRSIASNRCSSHCKYSSQRFSSSMDASGHQVAILQPFASGSSCQSSAKPSAFSIGARWADRFAKCLFASVPGIHSSTPNRASRVLAVMLRPNPERPIELFSQCWGRGFCGLMRGAFRASRSISATQNFCCSSLVGEDDEAARACSLPVFT